MLEEECAGFAGSVLTQVLAHMIRQDYDLEVIPGNDSVVRRVHRKKGKRTKKKKKDAVTAVPGSTRL